MRIGVPAEVKATSTGWPCAGRRPGAGAPARPRGMGAGGRRARGRASPTRHYARVGARRSATPTRPGAASPILKVKEPQPSEFGFLRDDQVLFTYLHLAANPRRGRTRCSGRARRPSPTRPSRTRTGRLPLLAPMSEIAGRLAVQAGARYLERPLGGRGVLLGGVAGVAPGSVVVIGGGIVGTNAAVVAAGHAGPRGGARHRPRTGCASWSCCWPAASRCSTPPSWPSRSCCRPPTWWWGPCCCRGRAHRGWCGARPWAR